MKPLLVVAYATGLAVLIGLTVSAVSTGVDLINTLDDLSVVAGFTILAAAAIAWLYVGLRIIDKYLGEQL